MSARTNGPEHIKKALAKYMRDSGLRGKIGKREIFSLWAEIVGPDIAAHTRITAFRNGALSVAVDSAAHFYELSTFFNDEIKEKLNQHLSRGFVRKINFIL